MRRQGGSRKDLQFAQIPHNAPIPPAIQAKVQAHVAQTYHRQAGTGADQHRLWRTEGRQPRTPGNKYTAIRDDKPKSKDDAKRPEFKVCKFTTEVIITARFT
jgi:ParB family chromosome partitioning protein